MHNWVQYHAETGSYDVKCERDERTAVATGPIVRKVYRFQVQGPNAMKIIEKATGKTPPDLKFFNMTRLTIGKREVRALRHGMAGQPGFELFGPWAEGEEVKAAICRGGQGLRPAPRGRARVLVEHAGVGLDSLARCRRSTAATKMKAYRQWLPANGFEGRASLGGSFYSNNIEDYYLTPYDLGYGPFVKFDHDFIGREALEKKAKEPQRNKVTLALNDEDVTQRDRARSSAPRARTGRSSSTCRRPCTRCIRTTRC